MSRRGCLTRQFAYLQKLLLTDLLLEVGFHLLGEMDDEVVKTDIVVYSVLLAIALLFLHPIQRDDL